jgi:hypothetical protein
VHGDSRSKHSKSSIIRATGPTWRIDSSHNATEAQMQRVNWPTALIVLGFLGLVGVMFWRASNDMTHFDLVWSAAGPIVGIVVGAIPGAIFGTSAHRAQRDAQARAELYAARVPAGGTADVEDTLLCLMKGPK